MDETILPTRGGGMLTEGGAGEAALLRGVVWVQREKLFARWKERFCILTRDYLHCFKKGSTQLTECGPFLFKVCFMYFCQLLLIETSMPDHPPIPEKQVLVLAKSKSEGGSVIAHCASETV